MPGVQGFGRYSIERGLPPQIEISIDGISAVRIRFNSPDFSLNPSPASGLLEGSLSIRARAIRLRTKCGKDRFPNKGLSPVQ